MIFSRLLLGVLIILGSGLSATWAEQLPQSEPWMRTLRDYLGTFRAGDFALELEPVRYEPSAVETVDTAYPVWMALCTTVPHQPQRSLKSLEVFSMSPEAFLLKTMEAEDGVRMAFSKGGMTTPMPLLWWEEWNYPGNPFQGKKPLLNRAFVMAAADLILSDALIRSGTSDGNYAARTSFVGGRLVWQAYAYLRCKSFLPPEVARAYEAGLERVLAHLEKNGPDTLTDNMNGKTLPGLVYLAQAVDSPEIRQRAEKYAARICGASAEEPTRQHPAGVIRDATGIETSYNGLYLHFLVWAAAAQEWPLLQEALGQNYRLKNHLTLPEPDKENFYGPSHFNVRVAHDSANDQWGSVLRDVTAAMISPEASYLVSGARRGYSTDFLLPPLHVMQEQIQLAITKLNGAASKDAPQDLARFRKFPAKEEGAAWVGYLPFFTKYYRPGTYARLRELAESGSPRALPTAARGETLALSFPDDKTPSPEADQKSFLIAERPTYYLVVYTGRLGHRHPYMNWGGGGISAFWTPQTGSLILGRSAGYKNNSWSDWRIWPVNAVSGITEFGDAFSTALLRRSALEVEHSTDAESVYSRTRALLNAETDKGKFLQRGQLGELIGDNRFEREVQALPEETRVVLRFHSDGKDKVRELFEVLPVFLKDVRWQKDVAPTRIEIWSDGAWIEPTAEFKPGVSKIRLSRFAGLVEIELDRPRGVRLSPQAWSHAESNSELHLRNVQIDLLDGATEPVPFPSKEISYRIRPLTTSDEP